MRAVYADALVQAGDPRGELIALACALEAAGVPTVESLIWSPLAGEALATHAAQHRRVQQLRAEHEARWIAELPGKSITIRALPGGFATHVRVGCYDDGGVAAFGELLAREPVRVVELAADASTFAALAELPLGGLRELTTTVWTAGELAPLLAATPNLVALHTATPLLPPVASLAAMPRLSSLWIADATVELLDELAASPVAGRLRRLRLEAASYQTRAATDQLVVALDGRFPNLAYLSIAGLAIDDAAVRALGAQLVVPEELDLTSSGVGTQGLAAIANAPTAARLRSVRTRTIEHAGLAALLGGNTPNLAELYLEGAQLGETTAWLLANATQRLRRLELGDCGATSAALGSVVAAHDLEQLSIRGRANVMVRVVANEPRARSLRDLDVAGAPLGEDVVRALAESIHLPNLRRLQIAQCGLGDPGVRMIAESPMQPDLVVFDFAYALARPPAALRERPALAQLRLSQLGDRATLAATRAHFGILDGLPPGHAIVVLFDGAFNRRALDAALRGAGFSVEHGTGGDLLLRLDGTVVEPQIVKHGGAHLARAAAVLDPARAARIATLRSYVDLGFRERPKVQPSTIELLVEAIVRACDGVAWDLREDRLTP